MQNPTEQIALRVNGEETTLSQVLSRMRFSEDLGFLQKGIDAALIHQAFVRTGQTISDEELQQAADTFRSDHGLHSSDDTRRWLRAHYLSFSDWEGILEAELIARKLRSILTEEEVERYFASNRLSFDEAVTSQLELKEEGVARELRVQILEENEDFHDLARRHSVDEATRLAGGYLGPLRRRDLPTVAQPGVFGARPGDVVGPITTDGGWKLFKIEELRPATLSEATREEIKSLLFNQWLVEQRNRARVEIPLFSDAEGL